VSELSLIRRLVVEPAKRFAGARHWERWRTRYWTVRQKLVDRAENRKWRVTSPRLIVVSESTAARHFYWYFLEWLGRERPSLRRRIYLDRLPCRLPPGAALLHAWVHDPVIERAPRVYAHLVTLETECALRGVAVVHRAAVLSNSKRDILCDRLGHVGLRTPRIVMVDNTFHTHRGGLDTPMLVRHRWGHEADMRLLDTEGAFDSWWADARRDPQAWVAGEYIDVRSGDGWYRKYRYFMAGSRGCPRHLIVSPHWEVRPKDRIRNLATREEELAYVTAACPHHAVFDAARRALGFDIAAFDYSYDVNGELVVWEVNPNPDLSRPRGEVGDYLAPAIERSYAILADFYSEQAGLTSDERLPAMDARVRQLGHV
jgi:hypothetical protein